MRDELAQAGSITLAIMFLIAFYAKARGLSQFRDIVQSWNLVPTWALGGVAVLVPGLEGLGALGLLLGPTRWAAAFLGLFMAGLTLIAALVYRRNKNAECGCFSMSDSAKMGPWYFTRNALLILMALGVAVSSLEGTELSLPRVISGTALSLSLIMLEKGFHLYGIAKQEFS